MTTEITKEERLLINALIHCVEPLLSVGEDTLECWVLWLDFLLEAQSKIIAKDTEPWDKDFGARLAENFRALAETFKTLNSGQVKVEELKTLRDKLHHKRVPV